MALTLEQLKIQIKHDATSSTSLINICNSSSMRRGIQKSKSQNTFLMEMSPYSIEYFLPVNSIFLFEENNKHLLSSQDYFLIRDGLYTLLNFFHYHPTPENISSIFLIHQRLSSFVPLAWKKQVAYYNYDLPNAQANKNIILSGLFNNNFVSLDAFEKKLDQVKKTSPNSQDFLSLLTHRSDLFIGENDLGLSHIFFFCKLLMKKLGTQIDFLTVNQIESLQLNEYSFVDFNENLLTIADDYMIHLFLSKGVPPLFSPIIEKFNDDVVIPCSPHHSLRISFAPPSWTKESEDKIFKFKKILGINSNPISSEKYLGLSPDFFLFCRDLAKELVP